MHNLFIKFSLATLIALFTSQQSFAQDNPAAIIISPSFSIRQTTGGTGGDQTSYLVNVKGGYRLATGWYFGMLFSNQLANGVNAISQKAIGNSVGYFTGKVSFIATYFMTATQVEKSATSELRRTEGSGFQADLNVLFPLTPTLTFGPTLSYKTITFLKTESVAGSYVSDKHAETYIYPYITFLYSY